MVSFKDRWEQITNHLRSDALALGIPEDQVVKGAFEATNPPAFPYVMVAMVPGDFIQAIDSNPLESGATVEIFVAVATEGDNAAAIVAAHDLAVNVVISLNKLPIHGIRWPDRPIVVDTIDALFVAMNVQISVPYNLT